MRVFAKAVLSYWREIRFNPASPFVFHRFDVSEFQICMSMRKTFLVYSEDVVPLAFYLGVIFQP